MEVAMIDDEFIHNNADEIVIFMVKNMPDKASLSRNWKFNMKKEGVSDNITYVGFAHAYINDKKINSYHGRIDMFYDKEALLEDKIKNEKPMIDKLENHIKTARKIISDLQDQIQERFEGDREDAIFDREGTKFNLVVKYGTYLL
mgnify:FL=1